MAMDDRLTRLERLVPDIDDEIERLLGHMTPEQQAAFIEQCAIDFGVVQSFGPTGPNDSTQKKDGEP